MASSINSTGSSQTNPTIATPATTSQATQKSVGAIVAANAFQSHSKLQSQSKLMKLQDVLLNDTVSYLAVADMNNLAKVCKVFAHMLLPSKLKASQQFSTPIKIQLRGMKSLTIEQIKTYIKAGVNVPYAHFFKECHSLRNLFISRIRDKNTIITYEEILPSALKNCSNLEYLEFHLNHVTRGDNLTKLLPLCNRLRGLQLGFVSSRFRRFNFESISKQCSQLTKFGTGCMYYNRDDDEIRLTDKNFEQLAERMSKLTSLVVGGNDYLTDAAILPFINTREMEHLDLSQNSRLTDATILALAENAASLQMVQFKCNTQLTDEALRKLFMNCNKLRCVNLDYIGNLSDTTIILLANNSPNLEELGVKYNALLTDVAIVEIAKKCPNLKEIRITGCSALTQKSFMALTQFSHQLERISLNFNFHQLLLHLELTASRPNIQYQQ